MLKRKRRKHVGHMRLFQGPGKCMRHSLLNEKHARVVGGGLQAR
jgi:hypothetical protein